ncbi:MAG: YeeE/YedE family protein [Thiotrichales bacterium]|nr:YeeE/YedE family protein [Thiotrichales bacterium]
MHELPAKDGIRNYVVSFVFVYRNNFFGLLTGILFGFLMSHAGATTYDFHAKMFLFENFQLMIVIGTAVTVAMVGVLILKRLKVRAIATGNEVDFVKKPYQKGLMVGALLFGIGWGMSASCPGTIPAMIGEGKIGAIFALIGLLIGTMVYGLLQTYLMMARRHKALNLDDENKTKLHCPDNSCDS